MYNTLQLKSLSFVCKRPHNFIVKSITWIHNRTTFLWQLVFGVASMYHSIVKSVVLFGIVVWPHER